MEQWSERYQGLAILVLLLVVVAGVALWYVRAQSGELLVVENAKAVATRGSVAGEAGTIKVYVTGSVLRPGVYSAPVGARVENAIEAAGGLAVDADRAQVNLASFLKDGQHIHVPSFRETLGGTTGSGSSVAPGKDARVNVNRASAAELERLPRIGAVIAGRIVAYREEHGPFKSVDELKEFKLLREADLEQIRDLICAE